MEKIDLPKLPSTVSALFLSINVLLFGVSLLAWLFADSPDINLCKALFCISVGGIIIGSVFYYGVERYLEVEYNDRYGWQETLTGDVVREYFIQFFAYFLFGLIFYVMIILFTWVIILW